MMFVRVKRAIPGRAVGDVVRIETDERGTPLERHWRRRLRDSAVDGCLEVVPDPSGPAAEEAPAKAKSRRADPAPEKE
jgi:hypothetical protein